MPVLCYHLNLPGGRAFQGYNVHPRVLRKQLESLRAEGYRTIRLAAFEKLLRGERPAGLPARPLLLTFDDGAVSNLTVVEPLLRDLDFSAVLFLYPSILSSKKRRHLRWHQARKLAASNRIEIGSHTYWHPKLPEMTRKEIRWQLRKSREALERRLRIGPIRAIAYPFGLYDRRVIEEARQAGYTMGFTIHPSRVTPGDDPFTLNRYMVGGGHSLATFRRMVARRSPAHMRLDPPDGSIVSAGETLRLTLPGMRADSVRVRIGGRALNLRRLRDQTFVGRLPMARGRRYLLGTVRARDLEGANRTRRFLFVRRSAR